MLRRAATSSSGALRAAALASAAGQSHATSAAAVAAAPVWALRELQQSRGLVSSVLLTKDAYNERRVTELKTELKARGLTTSGRRDELIGRLLQDDARKAGSNAAEPPAVPQQQTRRASSKSSPSLASLRGNDAKKGEKQADKSSSSSNTSSLPKADASKDEKAAKLAQADAKEGDLVIDPSSIVSARSGATQTVGGNTKLIADEIAEVKAPESNPPGVPPSEMPRVPETFNIKIPYEKPVPVAGPEVVSTFSGKNVVRREPF